MMHPRILLVAVIGIALVACSTPATAGPSLGVDCATFENEGAGGAVVERDLEAGVNQTLDITLCSNPSTGFGWEAPVGEGDAVVELVERAIHQTVGGPPGEAGQERFTFRTTSAGTGTIHLVYSQPWDGGQKGAWRLDVLVTVTETNVRY
jgi:predicted secreted protein